MWYYISFWGGMKCNEEFYIISTEGRNLLYKIVIYLWLLGNIQQSWINPEMTDWKKLTSSEISFLYYWLLSIDTQCCCEVFCTWRHSRLSKDWWWVFDKYTCSVHNHLSSFIKLTVIIFNLKPTIYIRSTILHQSFKAFSD